ncbi:MAG: aspartate kinase [Desulfovibrionaceae bacterium]
MKVVKIGGGCLKDKQAISHILDLVAVRGRGNIFVCSALSGVTDMLIQGMADALADEEAIPVLIERLKNKHMHVARHLICGPEDVKRFNHDLTSDLQKLERMYFGCNFTEDVTPKMRDCISSYGERFAVQLLAYALRCRGVKATTRMPHKIGLVTDGKFGDATADLKQCAKNLQEHLGPVVGNGSVLFIPGFFGVGPQGDIVTFGRGGSDYSAAVVAVAMQAEVLEIWKDTEGFMSADPRVVQDAQLIPVLSYEEAAELAYFGAKILHPRTVEPARRSKLDIAIKNTHNPDAQGSVITAKSPRTPNVIKSVGHTTDVCLLKVHASGVGARPGILLEVAGAVSRSGLNIKSVVTSQTCITFLLARADLEQSYRAVMDIEPRPFRTAEKVDDVALVSIVGEGLHQNKGIAAKCFAAASDAGVNVEMIAFGPSKAALYFLVKDKDLHRSVRAIHRTFFPVEA